MAKEKKKIEESLPRDFFYEITATLLLLSCLILLSELGAVGSLLKKGFKFIFGDFYFIVVIYLIAHSIYALLKQKWFQIKSLRFNGFLLFILNLLLLVHTSFLSLYNISKNSILADTLNLYKNALLNNISLESYGGGIIGAIFSQVLIVLLGRIGAIIFGIIFLIMGVSFITNLNFRAIAYGGGIVVKKIKSFFLFIYQYFKNIEPPNKKEFIKKKNLNLNLNLLDDIPPKENESLQLRISSDEKTLLKNALFQNNALINYEKMYVSYTYTRFIFRGLNLDIKENKIDALLGKKSIYYLEKERLIIESPNRIKKILSLKNILLLKLSNTIPLGIELNDDIIYFNPISDEHLLLSGDFNSGIKSFIKSFIVTLIFKFKEDFNLIICDYNDEFNDYRHLPNFFYPFTKKIDRLDDYFDNITVELEKRMVILRDFGVEDYLKLNDLLEKRKLDKLKPIYFLINNLNILKKHHYEIENKLTYLLKFGHKVGIHFIMISREANLSKEVISNVKTKLVFRTSSMEQSFEILQNKNACSISNIGDAFLVKGLDIYHLALPYISNNDFNRVIATYILG